MTDTPLAFKIGQINDQIIELVRSERDCFSMLPLDEQAYCAHLIAHPRIKMTRGEAYALGVTPGKIVDMLRDHRGSLKRDIVHVFFPDPEGIYGARIEINDLITATLDTVHVHVIIAPAEMWRMERFRRCVDSILEPKSLASIAMEHLGIVVTETHVAQLEELFPSRKKKK